MPESFATKNQLEGEPPEMGYCPQCGYDLRGVGERRCPECGLHFTFEAIREVQRIWCEQRFINLALARDALVLAIVYFTVVLITNSLGLSFRRPLFYVIAILLRLAILGGHRMIAAMIDIGSRIWELANGFSRLLFWLAGVFALAWVFSIRPLGLAGFIPLIAGIVLAIIEIRQLNSGRRMKRLHCMTPDEHLRLNRRLYVFGAFMIVALCLGTLASLP